MNNKTYQLETLSCPTCAAKIEKMLNSQDGVESAEVAFMSSKVKVSYNNDSITSDQLKEKISKFGYKVLSEK